MNIVFFTGSGISAESGLQTFRDADGYWNQFSVEEIATLDGWYKDKQKVLDFYNQYRRLIQSSEPNKAHKAIAQFIKDHPEHNVSVITQNVDDLFERAGVEKVWHVHGSIVEAKSTYKGFTYHIGYDDIKLGQRGEDGSQLRPNIVWFGENVYHLEECADLVSKCDYFCVIGTSLQVYPVAGLIDLVQPRKRIIVLDPNADDLDIDRDFDAVSKKATEGIDEMLELIF